uniref:Pilus assembly protein n=1 Tax=Thermorudis peleae TaxID=1382356 RepID=A0A831TEC6_9BACT
MKRVRRGQATVEFALGAMVFFMLVFGVIEAGRAVFVYGQLRNAAREGARYAAAHGCVGNPSVTPSNYSKYLTPYVRDLVQGIDPNALALTATWSDSLGSGTVPNQAICPNMPNRPGVEVTVTATYTFQPAVGIVFDVSIPMSASSTMRIHY